tara:strand:- start:4035 stop:4739 length:705 start_codon:yes stop_codon:yes gene_type:complete
MRVTRRSLRKIILETINQIEDTSKDSSEVWKESLAKIKSMSKKLLSDTGIKFTEEDIFANKSKLQQTLGEIFHIASVDFNDIDTNKLSALGFDISVKPARRTDGRRQVVTKQQKFDKITRSLVSALQYGTSEDAVYDAPNSTKNLDQIDVLDNLGYAVLGELIEPEGILASDSPDERYGYRIFAVKDEDLDKDDIRLLAIDDDPGNSLLMRLVGVKESDLPANTFLLFGEFLGC